MICRVEIHRGRKLLADKNVAVAGKGKVEMAGRGLLLRVREAVVYSPRLGLDVSGFSSAVSVMGREGILARPSAWEPVDGTAAAEWVVGENSIAAGDSISATCSDRSGFG